MKKYAIVAYCSCNYKDAFDFVIKSWLKQKTEKIFIYSDGEGFTYDNDRVEIIPIFSPHTDWVEGVARKVKSLYHFYNNYDYENILFMDIDAYPIKELGDIFNENFDAALTRFTGIVSSGLFFLQRNERTKKFIYNWYSAQSEYEKNKKHWHYHVAEVLDQVSLSDISKHMHKNNQLIVKPINYNAYSFKVEDIDKWVKIEKNMDREQIAQKIKYRQEYAMKHKDIKVLHFYNNNYRNKKVVNDIFKVFGVDK